VGSEGRKTLAATARVFATNRGFAEKEVGVFAEKR
jgi:hypothetical protein